MDVMIEERCMHATKMQRTASKISWYVEQYSSKQLYLAFCVSESKSSLCREKRVCLFALRMIDVATGNITVTMLSVTSFSFFGFSKHSPNSKIHQPSSHTHRTMPNPDDAAANDPLLEPFRYINSVPGKNVRGKLIECFQYWFRVENTTALDTIRHIVADLHNASLLIDDIEDNSKLRRGNPVAHSIFGVPATINCANYVYFIALERCRSLQHPDALRVFSTELLELHRGQGFDILWRERVSCPSEEEYLDMVRNKTGGLFRLAVGLLQTFATHHTTTDMTALVNDLAVYFQIRDDYINLADEEYMKSKSFCEDITEGKLSYPIVHGIRTEAPDTKIVSILKQRTEDPGVKRYAQKLLKQLGSLEHTIVKCTELKVQIENRIAELGGNPELSQLLGLLHVQLDKLGKEPIGRTESNFDEP